MFAWFVRHIIRGRVAAVVLAATILALSGGDQPARAEGSLPCDDPMVMVFDTSLRAGSELGPGIAGFGVFDATGVVVDWGGTGIAYPATGTGAAVDRVQVYRDPPNPQSPYGWIGFQYDSPGSYTVRLCGAIRHFTSAGGGTHSAMTKVLDFGTLGTTNFSQAFYGAWDLTAVPDELPPGITNTSAMFEYAANFNSSIGSWDTSHVTDMSEMFHAARKFNQPIGTWDTSQVTNMELMFEGATAFDQPIGSWDTGRVQWMGDMFADGNTPMTMSVDNYDNLLLGWAGRIQQHGVGLSAPSLYYSQNAAAARSLLIIKYGWTIRDHGLLSKLTQTPTPKVSDASPVTDQVLSVVPGTWGPSAVTLKCQWYRKSPSGTVRAISGATGEQFKVRASDVGYRLRVKVTGSLSGAKSVSKVSAWTSKVAKAHFNTTPAPTFSGVARVGMPLKVVPGSWDPVPSKYRYQWYRVSSTGKRTAIKKATKAVYTPKASDKGRSLKVRVKAYRAGYVTTTRYSAATTPVLPGMVGVTPRIDDTSPAVGQTLTVNEGAWVPGGTTFAYRWYAKSPSGKVSTISGATGRSYQVEERYRSYQIRVKVTGTATDYAPVAKTSAYTAKVTNPA